MQYSDDSSWMATDPLTIEQDEREAELEQDRIQSLRHTPTQLTLPPMDWDTFELGED